jgi:DNA-binding transcriptional MerR regulator
MIESTVPGTVIPYTKGEGMFSVFRPMIQATGGLSLGQVCSITGLEPAVIQNWVKRGFVAHPVNKKYFERQLARILLISSLRDAMKIDSIGELMGMVNGDANDESDDIISEEQLYDYLCEIMAILKQNGFSQKNIELSIGKVAEDYKSSNGKNTGKLKQALEIMVNAYVSAQLKKKAEQKLEELKKEVD